LNNQIQFLENRKNELMNELKKANIEYEKMKYLETQEIKKMLKKSKLKMQAQSFYFQKNPRHH
jgi:acetyl-CoA acetyltransferase